ncbi:MAG TPA: response regulator [Saprospiraceae bacterium]|nr:response regulator [Saprospiraceae bacterium]
MNISASIPKVLYVDDDSDDCMMLGESFAATASSAHLVFASGGEEAIRYLHSMEENSLPTLIILDLNMPRWDGRQTLNYIKSDPQLAGIPVIILSTSGNKMDVEVCKKLGAASYLQKPVHYKGYHDIVRSIMPLLTPVA